MVDPANISIYVEQSLLYCDSKPYIAQFMMGSMGTFVYFLCATMKFAIPESELEAFNSNSILSNRKALIVFCILGGLIPVLLEVTNLLGCFIHGLLLRRVLLSFYENTE